MRDRFLPQQDQLAVLINAQASQLYSALFSLQVERLGLPDHCLYYFKTSHFNRLFFSIETSAHLLYRSITLQNKPVSDIVIMDYGAGVGTLYMLAKIIGCKQVIYNDFLEEWRFSALKIAEALAIQIDEYILGDIEDTLKMLDQKNILCDIITSRNVIEHVYKLDNFYRSIYSHQPQALIYSSTTANIYNPGAHIKHVLWHRKWEKEYFLQRMEMIKSTGLVQNENEQRKLAQSTRGLAGADLSNAIKTYADSKTLPGPSRHYTNTCQPSNGVWAEHLLTFRQYRKDIRTEYYSISFLPGFWDTHYSKAWKNIIAELMNWLIRLFGKAGVFLAPFIYVVAKPKK
jgi:2-polyprenyl-3-methyl-5-hydroxy-6-metoxy-1,4-benzoquinol methylase